MKRALALGVAGCLAAGVQAMGWGALKDLGAVGRRLADLDEGFRVPVTVAVRTPAYEGSADVKLVVAKGDVPGLRIRTERPIATSVEGLAGVGSCQLDLVVDGAGLWLTARPLGEGAPKRALALTLPVTGEIAPPPRRPRRGGGQNVKAIDGGFRLKTQDAEGRPVEFELLYDAGHWPTEFHVRQGEERALSLRFGTFERSPPVPAPPLPARAYAPLDMVGVARLLPLWKDVSPQLGPVPLAELFPMQPGSSPPRVGQLPKISLARLARGEQLGFGGLLRLASVFDEEELVTGLRQGVRKLRGGLSRSWQAPKRRGLFGRLRR